MEHCVPFWAAASPDYDVVNLNVQDGADLCNSLLKPNTDTTTKLWKGCVTQLIDKTTGELQTVQVPAIPLSSLVERIPSHVQVEYIKIDAQGFDLEVMKGALSSPHGRIQVVSLECMDVSDPAQLLYQGQPYCSQINDYLADKGWIFVKFLVNKRGAFGEKNAFFVSEKEYAQKVDRLAAFV